MTTHEAAIRLLAAKTPEEKALAEQAYRDSWRPVVPKPSNVIDLAKVRAERSKK
jgi:hypothetical protein